MRLVLLITLMALSCSLLAQSRWEPHQNTGLLILNESDTLGFSTGYQLDVGMRRVFDRDTLDDFFSVFVGASVKHFQWYNQIKKSNESSFGVSGELGFTPVDDVYFSVNAMYLTSLNAFVPHVSIEGRPFDKFIISRLNLVFSMEGGYIKYLSKPTSPTGYVGLNLGFIYELR